MGKRARQHLRQLTKCSHGLGVKEDGADRLGSPPELAAKLRQPGGDSLHELHHLLIEQAR